MTEYQKAILRKYNQNCRYKSNTIKNKERIFQSKNMSHDQEESQEFRSSDQNLDDSQQQFFEFDFFQTTNENAEINKPYFSLKPYTINSLAKGKSNHLNVIDQSKNKYQQLLAKKQANKKKFLQKLSKNIDIGNKCEQKYFSKFSNDTKEKSLDQKQQYSKCKGQNSQKKKIKLKKKSTLTSNQKFQTSAQKENLYKENLRNEQNLYESYNKRKQSSMNMSKNQFLFLEQYQKDQKEIMNRLLNIIEKEHNMLKDDSSLPNQEKKQFTKGKKLNFSLESKEPSAVKPIVINNFIKSPTEHFDRDLIQKELKIKLLEQNRNKKRNDYNSIENSRLISESLAFNSALPSYTKESNISSPNTKINRNIGKFTHYNSKQQNQKIDFERLYQKLKKQNQKQKYEISESIGKKIQSQVGSLQHSPIILKQSTKQQNFISQGLGKSNKSLNELTQSSIPQNSKVQSKQKSIRDFNTILKSKQSIQQSSQKTSSKKQNILMQIPFGKKQCQNVSLAEAFKKKFGERKSQNKTKYAKNNNVIEKENIQSINPLPSKNNIAQLYSSQTVKKQSVKLSKKKLKDKERLNHTLQTARSQSQNPLQTDRSLKTNLSKQPSKQLLDRLIYGVKVPISKKQMYQLTRKNYNKLPQIEAKKKQQQKRRQEQQRLQKIKEYQKRIRSSKNCNKSIESQNITNSVKQNTEESNQY